MAHVAKCDSCGSLDEIQNRVDKVLSELNIAATGLKISVAIPLKLRDQHLCKQCQDGIVSARFAELCGLLAPYQPARVAGFIQAGPVVDEPLSKYERAALAILSRRLLKA